MSYEIEYVYKRGAGWIAQKKVNDVNRWRQAAKMMNFGTPRLFRTVRDLDALEREFFRRQMEAL